MTGIVRAPSTACRSGREGVDARPRPRRPDRGAHPDGTKEDPVSERQHLPPVTATGRARRAGAGVGRVRASAGRCRRGPAAKTKQLIAVAVAHLTHALLAQGPRQGAAPARRHARG